ncbi:hypothetical protein SAMCFNEI73_Ch3304 [Sinorhizobium americanum]|uniref:Uncharacterized protein n=1 Tax=Sinorhizobium americanum TaxID=194963 RepID=A0A1L3LR80_9HYPH|nr:hypothetical protein SAMCFNEI73_Ch3304 [Sinorhizobium americanum]
MKTSGALPGEVPIPSHFRYISGRFVRSASTEKEIPLR